MNSLFYPWKPVAPPRAEVERLFLEHLGLFFYHARRIYYRANPCRDRGLGVEDVAAELMLSALKRLRLWKPSRSSFATWLRLEARYLSWQLRQRALRAKRARVALSQFAGDDFDTFAATADPRQRESWEIAADLEPSEEQP